jgi:hypothetical protein
MRRTRTSIITAAVLVGSLLLGACGDDEQLSADTPRPPSSQPASSDGGTSPGGSSPDDPVVTSPPNTDPGDGGIPDITWGRIASTPDLSDPVVQQPEELLVDPDDDRVVLVRFWGGVPECYAARVTIVEQGADRVVIRLETGTNPDTEPDTACIAMAVANEIAVTLDAPLGDRELVAAPGATPPSPM